MTGYASRRGWIPLAIVIYSIAWQGITQETNLAMPWPEFRQWLESRLADSRFQRAAWGVQITSLDGGAIVFSHEEQKMLSPASNSKLYTVALALETLGPEYRMRTSLYAKTKPNQRGVLPGDLVVLGRGDPTFNAKLHGGDILRAFEPLVFALTNAGIKRVKGDLVADQTFFKGNCLGSGWAWDDAQHYYGAEISSLTANDNVVEVAVKPGVRTNEKPVPCEITVLPPTACLLVSNRTMTVAAGGSPQILVRRAEGANVVVVTGQLPAGGAAHREELPVHRPGGLFLDFFRQALSRHGIRLGGNLRVVEAGGAAPTAGMVELASVDSPPLAEVARLIQKPSQNLYTDLLLAHVGETRRNAERGARNAESRTSEELGVKELGEFLGRAGLDRSDVFFEEGSGLSRNNLTTARATVALLSYASRQTWSNAFFEALPVAGVDGTLRNRLKGTPAEGNLRAKTGSLRWADSLAGTVTTAAGERLMFCLMLNRFRPESGGGGPRAEIDAIVSRLAAVSTRTR